MRTCTSSHAGIRRASTTKTLAAALLPLLAVSVLPATAHAAGLVDVITNLKQLGGPTVDLAGVAAQVFGVFFGINAVMKFKEHGNDRSQTPLKAAVFPAIAAALLIAIPTALGVGVGTLFGSGATTTNANGGNLQSITGR